jgi:hypothetical protein
MRYEVKSFHPHLQGQPDPRTAEEKATEWLNEIAKRNGRVVAVTTSPLTMNQHSSGGGSTLTTVQNTITIITAFD